ncbi:MAG: M48 family metallopeptidase [Candidatus Gastranaerophilales bacterium]|nr:M48 family metallopeptidase [Candidatus Gastranaerophilales bacterium]
MNGVAEEYSIYDGEERLAVRVVRSKRKSLGLQVKSDGMVLARVPERTPQETVRRFIEEHTDWILKKRHLWDAGQGEVLKRLPGVVTESGKRQSRRLVEQRVAYYAGLMGISYGRISMRNQRTRWGSCSSDGNLNFNCRLLFLPAELVDYVVVHELAHRRHMDHSPEFWQEVERYLPDYRERRARLRQYGAE